MMVGRWRQTLRVNVCNKYPWNFYACWSLRSFIYFKTVFIKKFKFSHLIEVNQYLHEIFLFSHLKLFTFNSLLYNTNIFIPVFFLLTLDYSIFLTFILNFVIFSLKFKCSWILFSCNLLEEFFSSCFCLRNLTQLHFLWLMTILDWFLWYIADVLLYSVISCLLPHFHYAPLPFFLFLLLIHFLFFIHINYNLFIPFLFL